MRRNVDAILQSSKLIFCIETVDAADQLCGSRLELVSDAASRLLSAPSSGFSWSSGRLVKARPGAAVAKFCGIGIDDSEPFRVVRRGVDGRLTADQKIGEEMCDPR